MRLTLLAGLLTLVFAGSAAAAAGGAALRAGLGRAMSAAGGGSGAYVYDLSARRVLYAIRPDVARPPASVEKLYTSTAALERLGPDYRIPTSVLGTGSLDSSGVWHGDLYLRGGGDPTFGDAGFVQRAYGQGATVGELARQLAEQAGISKVEGRVLGDESLFDALRGGPRTGFRADFDIGGTLSALAFDRGLVGPRAGLHAPAAYAADQLSAALHGAGVSVSGGADTGAAPSSATLLARVQSPPLSALLGLMNRPSDNFFAEMLVKELGSRSGDAGTTPAGVAVVTRALRALHVSATVVDGSGLSRADRSSPRQIVTLLDTLAPTTVGSTLRASLPVAGRTGTLSRRMRGTAAAGRCQAKTGTINGVSNLAGYCRAQGGHTLAFAILMTGVPVGTAHALQDNMTVTLARFADATPAPAPAPTPTPAPGTTTPPAAGGAAPRTALPRP